MSSARVDRFWITASAVAIAVAFVGFAPTYYLKRLFGTPTLPTLVHIHAVVFTAWLLVFGTQVSLVSSRRLDLHRVLGASAAFLIVAMVIVGTLAAIGSARAGLTAPGLDALQFLVVPLGALTLFVVLSAAGLLWRREPAMHKRLMLLATLSLLTPAIARLPFVGHRPPVAMGATLLLVLGAAAWDWRTCGSLHRAWVWGVGAVVISIPLRIGIAHSDAWREFAGWLVRL